MIRTQTILQSVLILTLAMAAAPANSAEAWQVFHCELEDGKTEAGVIAAAKKWLKAARTMKGGEELRASIHFPMAAASGEHDFRIVLKAPSFAAWGTFWDGFEGSPAQKVDQETGHILSCASSTLFEAVAIDIE